MLQTANDIRSTVPNSLFLNAGDEFQGTLFYSYYGGEAIADILNEGNFTAFTIGNHEFDGGKSRSIEGAIQHILLILTDR